MEHDIVLVALPLDFSEGYLERNASAYFTNGIISRETFVGGRRFPFGLVFLAKALLMAGYRPAIFDAYAQMWLGKDQLAEVVGRYRSKIFGISAISSNYGLVKWLSQEIHRQYPDATIVVGASLAIHSYDIVLSKTEVDVCVLGEGEATLVDLVETLNRGGDLSQVPGIAFKRDGQVIKNEDRKYIKDIDQFLPLPYELFDMDFYTKDVLIAHADSSYKKGGVTKEEQGELKTFSMIAGRGCPKNCAFCSKNFRGVRLHSVDAIVSEIERLKNEYGVEGFHFVDELVIVNKKRVKELCEKIKPLKIRWDGQSRIDSVDREMLEWLKDSGCAAIGYGVESGSDVILQNMKKGITRSQIKKVLLDTVEVGIPMKIQIMAGYPGETKETLNATVTLFDEVGHPGRRFAITTPLPGSELYDYALSSGLIKDEEEYLHRIQDGYGSEVNRITCNCTDMPDDKLLMLIRDAERQMASNFLWHHQIKEWRVWWYHLKKSFANPRLYWKKVLNKLFH
ncbi:MAG: B12-binding domain-containing radical SAM protein [Desulfobaccales bacterium]